MSDSQSNEPIDDALVDLLVKQIGEQLTPAEQRLLDVADSGSLLAERRGLERAVAAVSVAAAARAEPLPPHVQRRVEQQAREFFTAHASRGGVVDLGARRKPPPSAAGYSAWWVAAACVILTVFAWERKPQPEVAASTPAEVRADLLNRPGTVKIDLGATQDPGSSGVSGDVVWDPQTQRGFIRFVGLKPNDAQAFQYQIWIFDAERDQRYPVDGGVFDIPADRSEVIVPIHAAIAVRAAKAFAITIEKPGGVVVSGREHVVALAQAT